MVADNRAQFTLDINSREGVNALRMFSEACEKAAREGKKVEDQAHQTGRGFSAMAASFGGNLLANAAASSLAASRDFTKASFEIAVARESMEASFKAMLGSAERAKQAMAMIREAASKPGLTFDAATVATQRALGAGFNLETAVKVVTLFGNASALAGINVDEMNEAMRGFFQIVGRGKAEQEDLNQILDRIPQLAQPIIKEFGGRTSEAINKVSKSADDMAQRFIRALERMAKAPDLTKNALLNLQNEWADVKAEFGTGLLGDESVGQVNKISEGIKGLKPVAKDVGGYIADTFKWAADRASEALWGLRGIMVQFKEIGLFGVISRRLGGMSHEEVLAEAFRSEAAPPVGTSIVSGVTGGMVPLPSVLSAMQRRAAMPQGTGLATRPVNPSAKSDAASAEKAAADAERRRKEAQKEYILRLESAIGLAEVGQGDELAKLEKGGWFSGGLGGARAALARGKMKIASEESTGSGSAERLRQLREARDEERKAARERTANAEAMVSYAREEAAAADASGASYQDRVDAAQRYLAAQERVIDLKLKEAELDGDGLAMSTARVEAETERLKVRREASESILRAGSDTLGRQADIAGLRGQLARTPAEEAQWEDRRLDFLRQQAGLLAGVASEQQRYLQLLVEIKRIEDERAGNLTRGQELLSATLGGRSGVQRFIERQGGSFGLVNDTGPSFDWSRLSPEKSYRGDVTTGGLAGVLAGAAEGGIRDAAPVIYDAVRGAVGGTMANVVRGVGVG